MSNILASIVDYKKSLLGNLADVSELEISKKDFKAALSAPEFGFIMECKKASPSRGVIREDFDLDEILSAYEKYADAISVLTEDKYFHGSYSYLKHVSDASNKPVLCKDFILDPKQVRLARYYGADAVLLMLSVLNDRDYLLCLEQAKKLNMDVLTEVSNEQELERAIDLGSEIIGINNRNLRNLQTSLDRTKKLARRIPEGRIIVTESGISDHDDVLELAPYADACLVGSALMASPDLMQATIQLVYGDVKICGITNQEDLDLVESQESSKLGVIFASKSKRKVDDTDFKSNKPLVGVFQNQPLDFIKEKVKAFGLSEVQLHGSEDGDFINELKRLLDPHVRVSKVLHVEQQLELKTDESVDEYLLDSQIGEHQGGTGQAFDWNMLANSDVQKLRKHLRIAGGVSAENIQKLKQLGFSRIDICSGSEETAGKKSPQKLNAIFQQAKVLARNNFKKVTV